MRLAIILGAAWRAGMLRNAMAFAERLVRSKRDVSIVLGIREDGPYDWSELEVQVAAISRTTFRRFQWANERGVDASRIHNIPIRVPTVSAPRDHLYDFLDCDAWVIFSRSLEGYVVPCRPIAIFCADLIQKYVPKVFGGVENKWMWDLQATTFEGWRDARFVFSTTPATLEDVVDYAGVQRDRTVLMPMPIDLVTTKVLPSSPSDAKLGRPYILWVTNSSPHKNAEGAMQIFGAYYQRGGDLDLVICGQDTEKLNPAADNRSAVSIAFAAKPTVLARTHFMGEVTGDAFGRLVANASLVWHHAIRDNGTFVSFDAARAGKFILSNDYPQMRYIAETFGVDITFYDHDQPDEAASILIATERRAIAKHRPRHRLRRIPEGEEERKYEDFLNRLTD